MVSPWRFDCPSSLDRNGLVKEVSEIHYFQNFLSKFKTHDSLV